MQTTNWQGQGDDSLTDSITNYSLFTETQVKRKGLRQGRQWAQKASAPGSLSPVQNSCNFNLIYCKDIMPKRLIKVLDRLVLLVSSIIPLQFANQLGSGLEQVPLFTCRKLEAQWVIFFNLSSVFNKIQGAFLRDTLKHINVVQHLST